MSRITKDTFLNFFRHINITLIPNSKDNIKRLLIKILYDFSLLLFIVYFIYLSCYFSAKAKQISVITSARQIWYSSLEFDEKIDTLKAQNSDFSGWIKIDNTKIDNPIYKTDNNEYYLNYNQYKKSDSHGTVFFDCKSDFNDNNILIYGCNSPDGEIFGDLDRYRSIKFFRKNPIIDLTVGNAQKTYVVFAVLILNSKKSDDNGNIFNISEKDFNNNERFNLWKSEAFERSLYNTGVDIEQDEKIITLITNSNDFENSRLIVMARQIRKTEISGIDLSNSTTDKSIRYPAVWYKVRSAVNPFEK